MTPEQSRKIAYIIIIIALVSGLVAFISLALRESEEEFFEMSNADVITDIDMLIGETEEGSAVIINQEENKKEIEISPNSDVESVSNAVIQEPKKEIPQVQDSFINPDIMKYLPSEKK